MSLSAYRSPEEYRPELTKERGADGIAAESLFKDAIQRDPSLCNNCFADRFEFVRIEWKCGEQGWLPWSRRYCIPGRNDPDPRRDLRHDGGPICCSHCGHHTGKTRRLSKRTATAHAGRLSDALSARGIEHDRKTLLAVTLDRVSSGDYTGIEDAQVFPQAIREAVRAVQ